MARSQAPEIPEVPELTGLPVTVAGGLCAAQWCGAYTSTAWRGVAAAPEPVFAVAFGADAHGVRWLKSAPSWGNAVLVEVVHWPTKTGHEGSVLLKSLVWPPARAARTWEEIWNRRAGTAPPDGEIQVPDLGVLAALHVWGGDLDTPETWPVPTIEGATGRLLPLLHLTGTSAIRIDLLVIPRRLLRVGRCKIWRLKPRYRDAVPEPLRHLLCFGRVGCWPPGRSLNQRYGRPPFTPS